VVDCSLIHALQLAMKVVQEARTALKSTYMPQQVQQKIANVCDTISTHINIIIILFL
jgi:hypothetical protein